MEEQAVEKREEGNPMQDASRITATAEKTTSSSLSWFGSSSDGAAQLPAAGQQNQATEAAAAPQVGDAVPTSDGLVSVIQVTPTIEIHLRSLRFRLFFTEMKRWVAGRQEHHASRRHLEEALLRDRRHPPHHRLGHLIAAIVLEQRSRRAAEARGVAPPGDAEYAVPWFNPGHSQYQPHPEFQLAPVPRLLPE
jgi:hypothetical protein